MDTINKMSTSSQNEMGTKVVFTTAPEPIPSPNIYDFKEGGKGGALSISDKERLELTSRKLLIKAGHDPNDFKDPEYIY